MTCAEALPLVALELDGELDARSILELDAHVESCAACADEAESLRALSEGARAHLRRFEPSPALEARLARAIRPRRRTLAGVGALAAAAGLALVLGLPRTDPLVHDALAAHQRSLQVDHAMDVPSTDQHTVKPWFEGKVPFGVPVRDYAAEGFPLVGGRLDVLDGRPAAALVYRHGQHLVNLFVVDVSGGDRPIAHGSDHGVGWWSWTSAGLRYVLAGDVNEPDMDALARRMSVAR